MWSFKDPALLALLVLLPPLFYWVELRRRRGGRLPFSFSRWRGEAFRGRPGLRSRLRAVCRAMFWGGLLLLLLALAGPALIDRQKVYLSRGIDLIAVLDLSPSMSVRDMEPGNRFEAAREVIRRFVRGRGNDSLGLVSFGLEAALRVPPTRDHPMLLRILDSLQVMEHGDGTAIGQGIALAALHLEKTRGKERVIVLLTDGENNAGEIAPDRAAEIARRLGCRIYTVGIGREGEALLDLTDPRTGERYRGMYRGRPDEELLKRIARVSGGKYFRAGSPGILPGIFDEIDALEDTDRRVKVIVRRDAVHAPLILLGLLLILTDAGIRRGVLGERLP